MLPYLLETVVFENTKLGSIREIIAIESTHVYGCTNFARFFSMKSISKSLITNLCVSTTDTTIPLYKPIDNYCIADKIIKKESIVGFHSVSPKFAYQLRENRALVANHNSICTLLYYVWKNNVLWKKYINKDIFYYILKFLPPSSWTPVGRKGRLAIAKPKWARAVIKIYKKNLLQINEIRLVNEHLDVMNKRKRECEEFLSTYDEKKLVCETAVLERKEKVILNDNELTEYVKKIKRR